jgi:hypothetical protein
MAIDREAAERAISDFLRALGHDPAERSRAQGNIRRVPPEAFAVDLLAGMTSTSNP